jgi:hypothetical protein
LRHAEHRGRSWRRVQEGLAARHVLPLWQAVLSLPLMLGLKAQRLAAIAVSLFFAWAPASAQTVCPKYGACAERAEMTCEATPQSSFIIEACYSDADARLLINLRGTWYAYCNASPDLLERLVSAESPGRFYNERIKVRAGNRALACE